MHTHCIQEPESARKRAVCMQGQAGLLKGSSSSNLRQVGRGLSESQSAILTRSSLGQAGRSRPKCRGGHQPERWQASCHSVCS